MNLLLAALGYLNEYMEANGCFDYESPFYNTGSQFNNGCFEVIAYDWNNPGCKPYNFKWRDVEISWYKNYLTGVTANKNLSAAQIHEMLTSCLKSLDK